MDLYAELKVKRGASAAAIKAAYRRRAKELHPDKGGTTEAFDRLARAYDVLSDPAMREHYDRTGEVDEKAPDNARANAVQIIAGFIARMVEASVDGKVGDVTRMDIVDAAKRHIAEQIVSLSNQRIRINSVAARFEQVSARLILRPGADPILATVISAQAAAVRKNLARVDEGIRAHEDAIEMLRNYEYDWRIVNFIPGSFAFAIPT